tara:strand:- start:24766 stop:29376 length:4611 start_codon:yes stop_codon:yes gene_type:complete
MGELVTKQAITEGLNENHFNWTKKPDGSSSVFLKEEFKSTFSSCLIAGTDGIWVPVLDEEFSSILKKDEDKKKALEKFLREQEKITYQRIIEETLAKELNSTVKELLSAMEGECLIEFRKNEVFKAAHDKYIAQGEEPDYAAVSQFCVIMSNTANEKKSEFETSRHTNAKSYNSIKRAMDQTSLLYNYDVPKVVAGCRTVLNLNESLHIKKPMKKSWFRRFIDKVKVFFGAELREEVDAQLYRTGSMEKAAVQIVTTQVSGMYKNNAIDYIKHLKANKAARQEREAGKRVDFQLPSTELDDKKSSVPTVSKTGIAKGVVKGVATGVAGVTLANAPTSFLSGSKYQDGEKIEAKNLAAHIEESFTFEAKKQAFETMMQFVRDMYVLSDQVYANGEDKSIAESMSLQSLGFGRLEDEAFADFITRLSKSLGFDLETYQASHPELENINELGVAVHLLFNADDKMREQAFAQFLKGNPEKGIGLQFAADAFNKEFNKMKVGADSEIASSDNYFYILDLNKQVVEDLWMKTVNKNAIHVALNHSEIEEKLYNPEASGAATIMTTAVRDQLVSALPSCMNYYMGSAIAKREQAQKMSASHCQGIKEEYDRRYEEKHPKPSQVETQPEQSYLEAANETFWWLLGYGEQTAEQKTKSKPVTTPLYAAQKRNQNKWEAAESRVQEAGVPKAIRNELADIVRKKTNKVWQKQAKHTTKTILDWGGATLLKDLNETLTAEYARLVKEQAHPKLIADVKEQHEMLTHVLTTYSNDPDMFMTMPLDDFKVFSDAIRSAITLRYTQEHFKNIDEQADLYMAMMALNQLNSIYLTHDLALKLYEDVLPTEFDEIQTEEISSMQRSAIGKVVEISDKMFKDAMSGPIKQFEYFAQQRKTVGYRLANSESNKALPSISDKPTESEQSWLAWGASSAWSLFSGTASLTADTISRYTGYKISSVEVKTTEELNQVIVDSTHEYIRGEFFDSTSHVVSELFDLVRKEDNFAYLQGLIGDDEKVNVFAKSGFSNKEDVLKFINALAQDLGFDDAHELYYVITAENNKPCEAKLEEKKKLFSKVRKLKEEKIRDPFVSAKLTIRDENNRLIRQAQKGKLNDAANYMVVLSSLDGMTASVEMAQRETLAVELLLPEADKMLGLNAEQQGLWDALVAASEQRAKEYGQDVLRRGIASQLSDSVTRAQHFPTAMIEEIASNLNSELEFKYNSTVIEEDIIDKFLVRAGSMEQAIIFFQFQNKENIKPYVLNALSLHIVKMNQPEYCQNLLALEKEKLGTVDEIFFWTDLLSNAFAEQNHQFAANLLNEHIPKPLQSEIINKLVSDFDQDAKLSIDIMLMLALTDSEELIESHMDMIKDINSNCSLEYESFNQTISVTQRGWSQMVSDNDGVILDDMREIYVFMDYVCQQLENELVEMQESLAGLEQGSEMARLSVDAATDKLESYLKVVGKFNDLKTQWFEKEKIVQYHFDTDDRVKDNTDVWDAEIERTIKATLQNVQKTQHRVETHRKRLGIKEVVVPEQASPGAEINQKRSPRRRVS